MAKQLQTILLKGQNIPLALHKGRAGSLKIQVKDGILHVFTPDATLSDFAREFLQKKATWILKSLQKIEHKNEKREELLRKLQEGKILYRGQWLPLTLQKSNKRYIQYKEQGEILVSYLESDVFNPEQVLTDALPVLAKPVLSKKMAHWLEITSSQIASLRIKNVTSRWGSCSSKRNINLNWHLIFLPDELIDYVIIHELMHLREMNHSARFWAEVEKYCPDYLRLDKAVNADWGWVIGAAKEF